MPFDIGIGGGKTARVNEPARTQFPPTLGGAVEYSLAHWVYRVLEVVGGGMGAFLAGLGVQFLDRLEPALVDYAAPLIDRLLALPDLDASMRTFLLKIRTPHDAGGAAVLAGFSSQAGSTMLGNVLGVLLAKPTQALMAAIRPTLPDINSAIAMRRWGLISEAELDTLFAKHGYPDGYRSAFVSIAQMRASVADLIQAHFRGLISASVLLDRLAKIGVAPEDANWLIQNSYRLMDVETLLRGLYRGLLTQAEVVSELQKTGMPARAIDVMLRSARPIPGPSDLVRFSVREAYRDDVARAWGYDEEFPAEFARDMALHGFDPVWATRYWRSHWELPSLSMGYEMLHRRIISKGELSTLLKIQDIPSFWRDRLIQAAYSPLTRVDSRRMYGVGVLDRAGVKRAYRDLGYDETNAERLTEFTVRYEDEKGESKPEKYKSATVSAIIQAYKKRIITRAETVTRLQALKYYTDDIELLLDLADWEKEVDETPDYLKEYQKDVRTLVEKAYLRRLITSAAAREMLQGVGYASNEADYLLASSDLAYMLGMIENELKSIGDAYIARGINRGEAIARLGTLDITGATQSQVLEEWDIERDTRSRRLTEAQYRKCLTEKVITLAEYKENMRGLGYTEYDVWLLAVLAIGKEGAGARPDTGPLTVADRG